MFKVGDKVRRVNPDSDHEFWNEPNDNMFHGNIYTVVECDEDDIWLEETYDDCPYDPYFFQLVESNDSATQQTYTQSELSYIEELEDRIQTLESLCSDYAKIIAEKDEHISRQQAPTFKTM
jgi:hypothetical protein